MSTPQEPVTEIIRFPPFPQPPHGVKIVAFQDFKEAGIKIFPTEDGVERDGLNIPTAQLDNRHGTDEAQSGAYKKKKKKSAAQAAIAVANAKKTWWEIWDEAEDLRKMNVLSSSLSAEDRVLEAAMEFRAGRKWPDNSSGLQAMWDQFGLFFGLHQKEIKQDKDDMEIDDDSDFGDHEVLTSRIDPEELKKHLVPDCLDEATATKPQQNKLKAFLDDPEGRMKVFLSHHLRESGQFWSRNLASIPRLAEFFINYLIRNRVLPGPRHSTGLLRTQELVRKAKIELPMLTDVGKALPDRFSDACKECWRSMANGGWGYQRWILEETGAKEEESEEPKAKRRKTGRRTNKVSKGKEDKPVSVPPSEDLVGGWGKDSGWESGSGWDSNSGQPDAKDNGWGDGDTSGWGAAGWNTNWGADTAFGEQQNGALSVPESKPYPPEVPNLVAMMGPTVLPLTHTHGIVERGMRRVVAVETPKIGSETKSGPMMGGEAVQVEKDLDERFAKILLEPWLRWYEPTQSRAGNVGAKEGVELYRNPDNDPHILRSSRGLVVSGCEYQPPTEVISDDPISVAEAERLEIVDKIRAKDPSPELRQAAHNPEKDRIVALVEPSVVPSLVLGMGLFASWVEIARQEREGEMDSSSEGDRKRFWYFEELTVIIPSYYQV